MIFEKANRYIKANKRFTKNNTPGRINMLVNHYEDSLYEKIKVELKDFNIIEIDANSIKCNQMDSINNVGDARVSSKNGFIKMIDDNSILLMKGLDNMENKQHVRAILQALNVDEFCESEVKDKMRDLLVAIVFINTDDNEFLRSLRITDGKDQFSYYEGYELI